MRFRHAVFALAVVLACAPVGRAQGVATIGRGPADPPEAPEETPVVALSIRPAPEPQPALKYRLLPDVWELEPGNAALLYDTAIQLVSEKSQAEQIEKVRDWLDVPLEELPRDEIRRTLYALQHAVRYLELAARREDCDWQLPWRTEGPSMLLPGLSKLRDLARLLALKARLEIAEGQYDEALRTLQTGLAMARHTAEAPTLIHGLVAIAVADPMLDRVEELLQAPGAPSLYWALTALPRPCVDLRRGMECEANWLYVLLPRWREAQTSGLTPEGWKLLWGDIGRVLRSVQSIEGGPSWNEQLGATGLAVLMYPSAKRWMLEQGHTPDEVEAMPVAQVVLTYVVEPYVRLRDEQLKWFYVPYWQAQEGLQEVEESIKAARYSMRLNPLVLIMSGLGRVSFRVARQDRRIAALRCIEAVRLYAAAHDGRLPARLSDVTEVPIPIDPVTGEQFTYELVDGKATLYSPPPPGGGPKDGLHYELTIVR